MAAFTANDVKELREKTGVSMMECKKALSEADGDFDVAIKFLREKGLAAAAKKASRIAADGLVVATVDEDKKVAVAIEVNAETDFVAKNVDFKAFVDNLAKLVISQNPADVDALLKLEYSAGTLVEDELRDKILVIGENLNIRRFIRLEGEVVSYVHGDGRIGVLVQFEADEVSAKSSEIKECGKDVAMQVAALFPRFLDNESVPAEVVEEEKQILIANIKNDPKTANKPENILEKMVSGRIGKFYENNCLLNQSFIKDGDITIKQYVENKSKASGGNFKVINFVRFEKGEGLEKRVDDFASEVASMM